MNQSKEIMRFLDALSLPYLLYRHEPMQTIEACQKIAGIDWETSAMCKNLFLCNRQESLFYLLLLQHDRPYKTAVVSKLLGVSRLSFARPETLLEYLKLEPGAVNPLSLIFDKDTKIQLAIDSVLLSNRRLLFHPGVNDMSVSLAAYDFLNLFLPACRHQPVVIDIP